MNIFLLTYLLFLITIFIGKEVAKMLRVTYFRITSIWRPRKDENEVMRAMHYTFPEPFCSRIFLKLKTQTCYRSSFRESGTTQTFPSKFNI